MDRDFFVEGDRYAVVAPAGTGTQIVLAEGKLIEFYGDAEGIVSAIVLEKQGASERRRIYAPVGPGVVVKRQDAELDELQPVPFRVPDAPKALYFPDVPESEFGEPTPVVYEINVGKAVVVVHAHADPGDAGSDYEHTHVMLDSEDPRYPLHRHDQRFGLSPIYGQPPSPIPGASS